MSNSLLSLRRFTPKLLIGFEVLAGTIEVGVKRRRTLEGLRFLGVVELEFILDLRSHSYWNADSNGHMLKSNVQLIGSMQYLNERSAV